VKSKSRLKLPDLKIDCGSNSAITTRSAEVIMGLHHMAMVVMVGTSGHILV